MRNPVPPGQRARVWAALDLCAAAGYGLLAWGMLSHRHGPGILAAAGTSLACLPLAWRRRRPLTAFAAVLSAFWLTPLEPLMATLALPPMVAVLYTLAGALRPRPALVMLGLALTGPVATALPDLSRTGAVAPYSLIFIVAWAAGFSLGRQREYGRALLAHQERLAEAEAQRARARVAEERLRIARELHDVVAHSMSIVTLQAGFGGLVVGERPAEARAALDTIETTGRQALTEMRRLLGVLREDGDQDAAPAPLPGLAGLDALIGRTARAGLEVELAVSGAARDLPAGVDLTAYRIVQESLTNVIKHAGVSRARVALAYQPGELVVQVTDEGRARPGQALTAGHGLVGMRERAAACGGELRAGPLPRGGFEVAARLPCAEDGW
ncbi:sensor histidine kinase [Sphaerisporangium sp. NPDC051011]|uniref:sensor histidine kinase n=1 Tax=Sphaerisporangium sp. NPDC051011 TaxID=3155792 RepID=UPI0033CD1D17